MHVRIACDEVETWSRLCMKGALHQPTRYHASSAALLRASPVLARLQQAPANRGMTASTDPRSDSRSLEAAHRRREPIVARTSKVAFTAFT